MFVDFERAINPSKPKDESNAVAIATRRFVRVQVNGLTGLRGIGCVVAIIGSLMG